MKSKLINYFLIFFLLSIIYCIEPFEESEDEYPRLEGDSILPSPDDPDILYIPIFHTNDIHGSFYPKKVLLPNAEHNGLYTIGGLEYMGKYAKIMKEEWGDRLLYFDTGDQFQGGLEANISNGTIMMDFFNSLNVTKSVLGNHEFDPGIDFLKDYMNKSNFDWVIDNIKNVTTGKYITFPHQNKSLVIEVAGIKLGIIGLTTKETPASSNTNLSDLFFDDYIKIINEESKKLRSKNVNAIIVIAHLGLYCKKDGDDEKLKYKLRDKNTIQNETCRSTDEAFKLLNSLEDGVIDILLSGHKHDVTHHWIKKFPVMSNDRNGKYAQIVYLPFRRDNKALIREKILMEGPLPICDKIFMNKRYCDLPVVTDEDYREYGNLTHFKFHNKTITKDPNITKIAKDYLADYNKYDDDILTKTEDHLEASKEKETNLADFYTDFLRHISGADIALLNGGSFRTPFYRGNITNATVHSFDPFGNDLVKFKAKGSEIIKMLKQLQAGNKGFYPSAGLRMTVREKPTRKLLSVKLWDGYKEEEIVEDKLYTIASNDFCFPLEDNEVGGDDFEKVYQWFRPREGEYIKIDGSAVSRDILINYLRNIDQLKGNKYYDKDNLRWRVIKTD